MVLDVERQAVLIGRCEKARRRGAQGIAVWRRECPCEERRYFATSGPKRGFGPSSGSDTLCEARWCRDTASAHQLPPRRHGQSDQADIAAIRLRLGACAFDSMWLDGATSRAHMLAH